VADREHHNTAIVRLFREAQRRRVFRVAAIYVVGAWLVLQIADVLLPGFGVPGTAIPVLLFASVIGFPIAMVFGWLFDVDRGGVHRTSPATAAEQTEPLSLQRNDYLVLAALAALMSTILVSAISEVIQLPRQDTEPSQAGAQPVARLTNSIVVLPFANISADPENEYFCEGVSEEIRGKLARFGELNIIGRTSSQAFKGRSLDVKKLAAILGVHYVLDGSVRKAGNRLRITASLLDEFGVQVWTDSFDRQLQDVFSIQSEVADTVARIIYPKVIPVDAGYDLPAITAFDHFLRGRALVHRRERSAALAELTKAIELDPEYPEALAEYAIALVLNWPSDAEAELARQAIDKALALRPGMARALAAQGFLLSESTETTEQAENLLRRALQSDPNMSDAANWLFILLDQQGRYDEAMEVLRHAFEIDPLHPIIAVNYANRLREKGEIEQMHAILQKLIDADPTSPLPYGPLIDELERQGQFVDMMQLVQRVELNFTSDQYWYLGRAYALLGDYESTEYWWRRTQRDFPHWPGSPFTTAMAQFVQGRYDNAAVEFEAALQERGWVLQEQHVWITHNFGWILALAGEYERAIAMLEAVPLSAQSSELAVDARQALAWAYLQTGRREAALPILQKLDQSFREQERQGSLAFLKTPLNHGAYLYALNTRMLGDDARALDLLQKAIDGGWRHYYLCYRDPRWDAFRDDPRFRRMMAGVKDDVDAQRAELEQIESPKDFAKRLDRARAGEPVDE